MKKKLVFCFDLDNVICETKKNYYRKSKPIYNSIAIVNKLYYQGHLIKIFTARFMGRSNENANRAVLKGYKFTQNQLKKWKVKYHYLIFGKPSYDILIDDKSFNYKKNWYHSIKKKYL